MNIEILQALRYQITPFLAPASPAVVIGYTFYIDLTNAENWFWPWAALAAVMLALTIELGGMLAAKGITDFWARKDYIRMFICFVALILYAYFGISMTWGTNLWPVFLFITALYMVIACMDTYKDLADKVKEGLDNTLLVAQELTQQEKHKASGERAKYRTVSFSHSPVKNDMNIYINPAVKKTLSEHPNPKSLTYQQIADLSGVAVGTAHKHTLRYFEQLNGKG